MDKERKIKETPDLTVSRKRYKMDLIPPELIIARYFATERAVIGSLEVERETVSRELEEFVEEHTGQDGLLEDAINDKGKITKAGLKMQITTIPEDGEPESDEERKILTYCLALIDAQSKATKAIKDAQAALDLRVLKHYTKLTDVEIKLLVVEDKWFTSIRTAVEGEVQRLAQQLAGRVKELEERYARPLPVLERDVEVFSERVEDHLRRMGAVWV